MISLQQAEYLRNYFKDEQKNGNFLDMDFSNIQWEELDDTSRREVWKLIYTSDTKRDELKKVLYGLGAWVRQE